MFFIMSGCSGAILGGGSNPEIGPTQRDDIGNGLRASINSFDSSDLALTQSIYFDLNLENSNLEPIELGEDNIQIRTLPSDSSNQFNTIFSDESIRSFYDSLFSSRGSIFISDYSGLNRGFSLSIHSPKHTSDNAPYLNSDITMFVDIEYSKSFEYSSNMLINFKENLVNSQLLVKKGPFNLHSFELRNSVRETILRFEIEAQLQQLSQVEFREITTQLGNENLECSYSKSNQASISSQNFQSSTLSNQDPKLSVVCTIPKELVESYGSDNTQFTFSTSMDFTHEITLEKRFQMPRYFDN